MSIFKKKKEKANYLDMIPCRADLKWNTDEDGVITLEIENKGAFNKFFQKFFKKPKISYVHLDSMGSFVWPLIDGEKTVCDLAQYVHEHFGEEAEPLYPRFAKYIQILESYEFVKLKDTENKVSE